MGVTGINKIITSGDKKSAEGLIGFAKSQMEILINQMSFQNLKQGFRRIQPYNGVLIECSKVFDQQICKIWVEPFGINVSESEEFISDIVICFDMYDSVVLKKYKLTAETYSLSASLTIDKASAPWGERSAHIQYVGWGRRFTDGSAGFIVVIWSLVSEKYKAYMVSESGETLLTADYPSWGTGYQNYFGHWLDNSPTYQQGFYFNVQLYHESRWVSINQGSLSDNFLSADPLTVSDFFNVTNLTTTSIPDFDRPVTKPYYDVGNTAISSAWWDGDGYFNATPTLLDPSPCQNQSSFISWETVPNYSAPYAHSFLGDQIFGLVLRSKTAPYNVIAEYIAPQTTFSVEFFICDYGGHAWVWELDPHGVLEPALGRGYCTYGYEYTRRVGQPCTIIAVVPGRFIVIYLSKIEPTGDSGWFNFERTIVSGTTLHEKIVVLDANNLSVLYYLPVEQDGVNPSVFGGGPYQ